MAGRIMKQHKDQALGRAVATAPGLILKIGIDGKRARFASAGSLLHGQVADAVEAGQDSPRLVIANMKPANLIRYIEKADDPAIMKKRLDEVVEGAKAKNPHCLTAVLMLAIRSKDAEMQEAAADSLLEHFGDKDGILLYLAIHTMNGHIVGDVIQRMVLDRKIYLLELTGREATYRGARILAKGLFDDLTTGPKKSGDAPRED